MSETNTCPKILGVECFSVAHVDAEISRASFKVLFEGDSPEKFDWNWGNGKTKTTYTLAAAHNYRRPAFGEADARYTVKVVATGPQSCLGDAEVVITIPAPEKSNDTLIQKVGKTLGKWFR